MQAESQTADRLAILEQIARYSYAWDDRDLEAYVALFAEDAAFVVDPELPGRAEREREGARGDPRLGERAHGRARARRAGAAPPERDALRGTGRRPRAGRARCC